MSQIRRLQCVAILLFAAVPLIAAPGASEALVGIGIRAITSTRSRTH